MTMQLKLSLVHTESSEEGEMACIWRIFLSSEGIIIVKYAKNGVLSINVTH